MQLLPYLCPAVVRARDMKKIFFTDVLCAENRVFETKGTEKLFAGLYLENRYPAIIFQKIGGNDAHGNFNFLL